MIGLIATKEGMTRLFQEDGKSLPVSVLKVATNFVSQIKTKETDGYNSVQLSTQDQKEKNQTKSKIGHFNKNNISLKKYLKEFKIEDDDLEGLELGKEFDVKIFEEGQLVDVSGISKGKGFAGTVKSGGRNNNGRITTRHIGGGHKHHYRVIDFKRNKDGIPAVVERIEYDPNRSAFIALVLYQDGERKYIIAPKGIKEGSKIMSGSDAEISIGNTLELENIPVGTTIHCVELKPQKGAQLARSAGTSVQFVAKEDGYASIRLKSGEFRKVLTSCSYQLSI